MTVMLQGQKAYIVSDTCVPSRIVIHITINQLESEVLLKTIYCLRLFAVVYMGTHVYQVLLSSALP